MNKIADARAEDAGSLSNFRSPYFSQEHEMLRAQVRRFVETEIKPKALAWEEQGYVPREVLRRMGSLGFLGIRYPARYGGSEMDTLASVVLAEELGRSTFTGVSYTVLDHTDMASVHLFNSGSEAQKDKWMPRIISGEVITAVAVTEPDAGSDVKGIRTFAARRRQLRDRRHQNVHHQRRLRRSLLRGRQDRPGRPAEPLNDDVPGGEGHAGL